MSVFDSGVLRVEKTPAGSVLRYDLVSRALLYCFLAPLLFLAFAQATIALNAFHKPAAQAAKSAAPKHAAKEKPVQLSPLDAALGAPAPAKPDGEEGDEDGPKNKKPHPRRPMSLPGFSWRFILAGAFWKTG
jgi:outer membrane biosynthesis protein TonB